MTLDDFKDLPQVQWKDIGKVDAAALQKAQQWAAEAEASETEFAQFAGIAGPDEGYDPPIAYGKMPPPRPFIDQYRGESPKANPAQSILQHLHDEMQRALYEGRTDDYQRLRQGFEEMRYEAERMQAQANLELDRLNTTIRPPFILVP